MSSLPPDDDLGADPIATAQRVFLMKRLMTAAIDHYRASREFCREIDQVMPEPYRDDPARDDSTDPECRAWWRLFHDGEMAHWSAEGSLAQILFNLHRHLAALEDRRSDRATVGSDFQERAVSMGGWTYILVADPADFDPGQPMIAMVENDRVIGLD